jgi:hypothetical protein
MDYKRKTGHLTKTVLIVCNYHFVRDHADRPHCPPLKPQDCSVSIKVSSTVFRGRDSSLEDPEASPKDQFYFDGSGAQMPYSTFLGLLNDPSFANFMSCLQEEYEKTEGPIFENNDVSADVSDKDDNDNDDDDDKEEEKQGAGGNNVDDNDAAGDADDKPSNKA